MDSGDDHFGAAETMTNNDGSNSEHDENADDDESALDEAAEEQAENAGEANEEDEEDESSVPSQGTDDDAASAAASKSAERSPRKGGKRAQESPGSLVSKKSRSPSVAGLAIPFRTVKKAMKLDPDIPIVQNEAAIMTTLAAELFLKSLAIESFRNAKSRGRNTIRYEDVAEARTKNPSLAFLEALLP